MELQGRRRTIGLLYAASRLNFLHGNYWLLILKNISLELTLKQVNFFGRRNKPMNIRCMLIRLSFMITASSVSVDMDGAA